MEKPEMNKVFLDIKVLVTAATRTLLAAVTLLAVVCSPLILVSAQQKGKSAKTEQQAVEPDRQERRRADALLAQMTLEEKIGQMNQLFFFGAKPVESVNDG